MHSSAHKTINYLSVYVFLPLLVFMLFSKTVGVSYEPSFLFAGKILLIDIIPGAFLLWLLRPDIRSPLIIALYAPALGMILEISTYLLCAVLGLQNFFLLYYALPILLIAFFTRRFFENPWSTDEGLLPFFGYAGLVFLTLMACTIPFVQSGLGFWVDDDTLVQVIIAQSLQQGYPFRTLLSEGRPLYYNFGYHLFVEATRILSGESTFLLGIRLAPVYCFTSLFFSILAFCLTHLKNYKYILASLLMLQLFAVAGVNVEVVGKIFGGAMSAPISRIHSNILGFTFTFLISDFILFYLKDRPNKGFRLYSLLGAILLIAFITAGTRSSTMMFIAGGLALLFCVSLLYKNKKLAQDTFILGIVTGTAFAGALVFFYGVLTPEAATNFQSLQGLKGQINYIMHSVPWAFSLSKLRFYMPETLAGIIVIVVFIIFKAGFLSFAYLAGIYTILSEKLKTTPENIYYLGGFFLTLIIWSVTMAPGGSHYPYLHYTGLAASLLAVTFLSTQNFTSKFSKIVLAGTVILFGVHIWELVYHLLENKILLVRRYQQSVSNYMDLVGPGLANLMGYLRFHAKDSAFATTWGNTPPNMETLITHIILAEAGIPILNDSRYMHTLGMIKPSSPFYSVYLNRLNASQIFRQFPEKAIYQLYQSLQDKSRTLYILAHYPIDSTSFQSLKLEYILTDFYNNYPYILYKVKIIN